MAERPAEDIPIDAPRQEEPGQSVEEAERRSSGDAEDNEP
jgi:hypothetical protein